MCSLRTVSTAVLSNVTHLSPPYVVTCRSAGLSVPLLLVTLMAEQSFQPFDAQAMGTLSNVQHGSEMTRNSFGM